MGLGGCLASVQHTLIGNQSSPAYCIFLKKYAYCILSSILLSPLQVLWKYEDFPLWAHERQVHKASQSRCNHSGCRRSGIRWGTWICNACVFSHNHPGSSSILPGTREFRKTIDHEGVAICITAMNAHIWLSRTAVRQEEKGRKLFNSYGCTWGSPGGRRFLKGSTIFRRRI